ncbi:MAG: toll/interleukin-1 receptor domain-containing protein [Bacteroidales bacterium]|nr:toll/interleukin-1 receptor domain-containing protein [Bacteroidales bacterium]
MKNQVFISYSIEDSNLYLITLLLEHLKRNKYSVAVSAHWEGSESKIAVSDVFIGIITNNSNSVDYVVKEWKIAKENNIPDLLIVEDGVKIDKSSNLSYIRFNRSNPDEAIDKLFNNNKFATQTKQKNNNTDITSDIFKGIILIAGLAALISLLSKSK